MRQQPCGCPPGPWHACRGHHAKTSRACDCGMAKVNADPWKQEAPPGSLACEKGGLDFKAECSTFAHPIHKVGHGELIARRRRSRFKATANWLSMRAEMLLFGRLDFQLGRAAAIVGLWCAYRDFGAHIVPWEKAEGRAEALPIAESIRVCYRIGIRSLEQGLMHARVCPEITAKPR